MSQLSLFDFKGYNIRIYGTTDEPWFLVKDVGEVLGFQNPREFVSGLKEDQKGDVIISDTRNHPQKMTIINETALYKMIMKSRKPQAEAFTDWVCGEVLPSIRKKGRYELEEKNKELEERITKLEKKQFVSYGKDSITVSQRVIELGYITQNRYDELMRSTYMTIKGEEMEVRNVKGKHLFKELGKIAKCISTQYKKIKGRAPNINHKRKNNEYLLNDYLLFGDDVIREYFDKHPIETWGI